ncbi:hypothetical protein JCM10908_006033 [Rhodotorula pacifica]|uniref:OSTA/TMEM184 family protein n=1 Tax=Rhodotorula pacifica TaxID=1495444 RepID=UPI003173C2E7
MGDNYPSTGCPVHETLPRDPTRFMAGGDLNWQLHNTGWLLCGVFTAIASGTSIWLIWRHISFFYHSKEQRHVVRLLFMPVIYAVCSFASYYFYRHAIYWQLARDCYEALVIASFFFLLTSYLSNPPPTTDIPHPAPFATRYERAAQLRSAVKDIHLKKWMWPLGRWKWRPAGGGSDEGEAFLWWMRVCIGQYVLIRPLSTLAAVVGQATGYYCLASWSPRFIHVWTSVAITISVTIAMYCVLQLYMPLKEPLRPYKPVLKFLCVKSVVFFTFWQESCLSLLVTFDVIKQSEYWTAEEIVVGLAALLACFEMVVFAFLHVKAFPYAPYRALAPAASVAEQSRRSTYRRTPRGPALCTVLNLADLGREIVDEIRFICRGAKVGDELLLERRRDDFETVMGVSRPRHKARTSDLSAGVDGINFEALGQDATSDKHEDALLAGDTRSLSLRSPHDVTYAAPTRSGWWRGLRDRVMAGEASRQDISATDFAQLPCVGYAHSPAIDCDESFVSSNGVQGGAVRAMRAELSHASSLVHSVDSGGHLPRTIFRPDPYASAPVGRDTSPRPFMMQADELPPPSLPILPPEAAFHAGSFVARRPGTLPPGSAPARV